MKVKALIDCMGVGYNLKKDEIADIQKNIAEKLINFNYVEEVKTPKKSKEVKS